MLFTVTKMLTWEGVNMRHLADNHNSLALLDVVATFSAHSTYAGRAFPELKVVKSDWRTNFGHDVLTDCSMCPST